MISSLAIAQNKAAKQAFEQQGYKFSVGHDGWAVYFDADVVADGKSPVKGAGSYDDNLDRAVHAARTHQAFKVKAHNDAQLAKEAVKAKTPPSLQQKAVQTAVQFLTQAGALYRIEFEDAVFTNIPDKPVKVKKETVDTSVHWKPILLPFKEKGESFSVTLDVPAEYEFNGYVQSVRMHLWRTYGKGNALTETNEKARTMGIMVAAV